MSVVMTRGGFESPLDIGGTDKETEVNGLVLGGDSMVRDVPGTGTLVLSKGDSGVSHISRSLENLNSCGAVVIGTEAIGDFGRDERSDELCYLSSIPRVSVLAPTSQRRYGLCFYL